MQVSRYTRYLIGFALCFDVMLVVTKVFNVFVFLGRSLGRGLGVLGVSLRGNLGTFGASWASEEKEREHAMLTYFILVLCMFGRVLESRIWSCGRLGFEHVDMSLVL